MSRKKVISVRLSDDEIEFIKQLENKGIKPSTVIRFCIDFVMFIKNTDEFSSLLDKLPKDIKV